MTPQHAPSTAGPSLLADQFMGILGAKEGKNYFFLRCLCLQGPVESSFLTAITSALAFLTRRSTVRLGPGFGFFCLFIESQNALGWKGPLEAI